MNYIRTKNANIQAREIFRHYHLHYPENLSSEEIERFCGKVDDILGSYRKTKTPCSCYMCGNPRKWFGEKTRQEKIADINEKEQLGEYYG